MRKCQGRRELSLGVTGGATWPERSKGASAGRQGPQGILRVHNDRRIAQIASKTRRAPAGGRKMKANRGETFQFLSFSFHF